MCKCRDQGPDQVHLWSHPHIDESLGEFTDPHPCVDAAENRRDKSSDTAHETRSQRAYNSIHQHGHPPMTNQALFLQLAFASMHVLTAHKHVSAPHVGLPTQKGTHPGCQKRQRGRISSHSSACEEQATVGKAQGHKHQ